MVLGLAGNKAVTSVVSRYGMKWGAARFVAAENLQKTIEVVNGLNKEGLVVALDHLGESVESREEAIEATQASIDILDAIQSSGVDSNVSVKLTQLGLDIDETFCLDNVDQIARKAKETNNFLRIDMEDSPRVDVTLRIFNTLLDRYGKEHVGLVIQTYLYRSEQDVLELGKKNANLRIVKGAYKEPASVAFPNKKDVDDNFIKLVKLHLQNGNYTAIATHDEVIINHLKKWLKEENIPNNLYEFQMLFGVRNGLQRELAKEGYKVRVYTPYGQDWYPYFTRRLAERPANVFFILKNMFRN